jgi:hypothetical protein
MQSIDHLQFLMNDTLYWVRKEREESSVPLPPQKTMPDIIEAKALNPILFVSDSLDFSIEEKEVFSKLLAALSLSDETVEWALSKELASKKAIERQKVVIFSRTPPLDLTQKYVSVSRQKALLLWADPIEVWQADKTLKVQLWKSLKGLFLEESTVSKK